MVSVHWPYFGKKLIVAIDAVSRIPSARTISFVHVDVSVAYIVEAINRLPLHGFTFSAYLTSLPQVLIHSFEFEITLYVVVKVRIVRWYGRA